MVRINNREYAYGDIQVIALGRPILGLKEIKYTTKKEKETNYGAGRDARGIQHGKRIYEGTLGLTQSELQALNAAAKAQGFRDILDVELDIIVSYVPEHSAAITTDRIVGASFTEFAKGMKEGDMKSEHSLPFLALDIEEDI